MASCSHADMQLRYCWYQVWKSASLELIWSHGASPMAEQSLSLMLAQLKRHKLPVLDTQTAAELAAYVFPDGDPVADPWVEYARSMFAESLLAAAVAIPRRRKRNYAPTRQL